MKLIDLARGKRIAGLTIEGRLSGAEAGMSAVYRARTGSGETIALKAVPLEGASALRREATLLHNLVPHPNLVGLRTPAGGQPVAPEDALCETGAAVLLCLEFLPGGSLADLIRARDGRFEPDEVLHYGLDAAAAVAHLHASNIVHLDLKPGNFLLASDGCLVLADFGLARPCGANPADYLGPTGKPLGTRGYAAPELLPEPLARACPPADIFALGMILYELLSGVHPLATSPQIGPAQLAGLRMPRGLRGVLLRALDQHPAARYPSGADLLAALQNVARQRRWRRILPGTRSHA